MAQGNCDLRRSRLDTVIVMSRESTIKSHDQINDVTEKCTCADFGHQTESNLIHADLLGHMTKQ